MGRMVGEFYRFPRARQLPCAPAGGRATLAAARNSTSFPEVAVHAAQTPGWSAARLRRPVPRHPTLGSGPGHDRHHSRRGSGSERIAGRGSPGRVSRDPDQLRAQPDGGRRRKLRWNAAAARGLRRHGAGDRIQPGLPEGHRPAGGPERGPAALAAADHAGGHQRRSHPGAGGPDQDRDRGPAPGSGGRGAAQQRTQLPQPHAAHAKRLDRPGPGRRRADGGGAARHPQQRVSGWGGLQQLVLRRAAWRAAARVHVQSRCGAGAGGRGGRRQRRVRPLVERLRQRHHQVRHQPAARYVALFREVRCAVGQSVAHAGRGRCAAVVPARFQTAPVRLYAGRAAQTGPGVLLRRLRPADL